MENKVEHLIDPNGNKIEVPYTELEKYRQLNECNDSGYKTDIDWYLNNGYNTIENIKEGIIQKYGSM